MPATKQMAKKTRKAKTAARKPAATKRPAKRAARATAPRRARSAAKKAAAPTPAAAPPPAWVWHELMTGDVARAKAFYAGLFGWTSTDMPMPNGTYTLFAKGAAQLGGCMAIPEAQGKPVCPPHWVAYLGVADVDATVAKAASLGGAVDVPPTDIPGYGRFAVLRDPTGAGFAVYRSQGC